MNRQLDRRSSERGTLVSATFDTPLGEMTATADGAALCRLGFGAAAPTEASLAAATVETRRGQEVLEQIEAELASYFAGGLTEFQTPLAPVGTAFQRRVWDALLCIPAGETRSYASVARAIGDPKATRAVGTANGANPIAIVVPCHRVLRTGGALGGYAGGLEIKRWLLDHERQHAGAVLFS